ncbi:MAG: hypothetical protein HPAVJP_1370 [Candidatus Hepatoplasma vulgare]|nr:MAG: hypothetical protein HPAVJP_1370 [Candidatus Hepatoplasma sp.]
MTSNEILINKITNSQVKNNLPNFRTGDTVKIHLKIKEGAKERIQIFEGFILKRSKKQGTDATFTVRKESYGIGVEKTFFLNSPSIVKIEIVKKGKVRQSRIFYMRNRKGKSARIKIREDKKTIPKIEKIEKIEKNDSKKIIESKDKTTPVIKKEDFTSSENKKTENKTTKENLN